MTFEEMLLRLKVIETPSGCITVHDERDEPEPKLLTGIMDISDMIRAVDIMNLKQKGIIPVYDEISVE